MPVPHTVLVSAGDRDVTEEDLSDEPLVVRGHVGPVVRYRPTESVESRRTTKSGELTDTTVDPLSEHPRVLPEGGEIDLVVGEECGPFSLLGFVGSIGHDESFDLTCLASLVGTDDVTHTRKVGKPEHEIEYPFFGLRCIDADLGASTSITTTAVVPDTLVGDGIEEPTALTALQHGSQWIVMRSSWLPMRWIGQDVGHVLPGRSIKDRFPRSLTDDLATASAVTALAEL